MRIVIVAADFEENLGAGMIAAAAEDAGHRVSVLPFSEAGEISTTVDSLMERCPDVVGLGMQFQHRAHEFLAMARRLRGRGYRGHITCGGHFPTLAYREVLSGNHGVDSVVLHDGEETFVELLAALGDGRRLGEIAGLAILSDDGVPIRTKPRGLIADLDALPFAKHYRPHSLHMGIPFIPIVGSRGCWGACAFCSITSYFRDAKAYNASGPMLRHRSPENIAAEMALLCDRAGGRAVFCFHDDTFLLPRPEATIERVRAIREAFDAYDVGEIGIVGKARPDSITADLARTLAQLGVIRLYVGVENVSENGAENLNRSRQSRLVRQALSACREAGIFGCYNLLLFEPGATLRDVEENLAFMREFAGHPVNFCRAEPYFGTPLQQRLARDETLSGSYLGFDYRVADDRAELLFRICAAAFRQRNFAAHGLHNRYMGLGYNAKLIEHFYRDSRAASRREALLEDAARLTRGIAEETADFLAEALELARDVRLDDHDRIARQTALLGMKIAAADRLQHTKLDRLYAEMAAFVVAAETEPPPPPSRAKLLRAAKRVAQGVALGTLLTAWSTALPGCDDRPVTGDTGNKPKMDGLVADMVPPDAGVDFSTSDPLPPDRGIKLDGMMTDCLPPDRGIKLDGMMSDCLPPPDRGIKADQSASLAPSSRTPIDQWRDTTPSRSIRSQDLPLFGPPVASLIAERRDGAIRVELLEDGELPIAMRWESDGTIEGEGNVVRWQPESDEDQIRVGIRSKGGVAILALRAKDVHV